MIDYREVDHGHDILVRYFQIGQNRKNFFDACDNVYPGVAHDAVELFDKYWSDIRVKTYITSVSEHDGSEDNYGRLSMWRAFGSHPRVALVFAVPWQSPATVALGIGFSPVAYLDDASAYAVLDQVILNITNEKAFLSTVSQEDFRSC